MQMLTYSNFWYINKLLTVYSLHLSKKNKVVALKIKHLKLLTYIAANVLYHTI